MRVFAVIFRRIGQSLSSRMSLGLLSVAFMAVGYGWLSHRQHQRNPDDSTIPNLTQLYEGAKIICQPSSRGDFTPLAVSPDDNFLARGYGHARNFVLGLGSSWLYDDGTATLERLFVGLAIGVFASIVLGLTMGYFDRVDAFLSKPMTLLAKIPPTAALAVFFVMAGTGAKMYLAMIAFGVLPSLTQSIALAVRDVPEECIHKSLTFGASRAELLLNVIFPQVLPRIIDAIRLQIGPAMVYLIAAEMVVGDIGLGYRIRTQSRLLNMNVVYLYLGLLAGFGFCLDYALRMLMRRLCPWFVRAGA